MMTSPLSLMTWVTVALVLLMSFSCVVAQPIIQANGLFVVGKEKTIACYVSSAETPTGFPLTWSRDGVGLTASREQVVAVTSNVNSYNSYYKFNVTASDNLSVFRCTATFPSGTTSVTWNVYVYKGPDTPIVTGSSSVVSGVSSTWQCLVDGASSSAPNVDWQFGNNSKLDSDTFTSSTQVYTDRDQLEIHRVTSILTLTVTAGAPSFTLTCQASHFDSGTTKSADFPVTVQYPPQISGGRINYTATEGSTVTIYCEVTAYPLLTSVTWYKDSVPVDMRSGRLSGGTVVSPSLVFNNVARADVGFYLCSASNSQGTTNGTANYLTVRYIPIVTYSQNPVSGVSGSDLTLSCNINSVPAYTTVFWHRIDSLTGAKTPVSSISSPSKYAGGTAGTTPALTILNLDNSDEGLYRCVVDNNVGRGEGGNLQVQVNFKPQISGGQSTVSATEPQSVTLTCQVQALPAVQSLTWYKNGLRLDTSGSSQYSGGTPGNPSLTLTRVGAGDEGQYYCVAVNAIGSTTGPTTQLNVNYFPTFTIPNTAITASSGTAATLTVSVAANPALTYVEWRKRDTVSSSSYSVINVSTTTSAGAKYSGGTLGSPSLQIRSVVSADAGYYTLVARNPLGTRQSSEFVLTVSSIPPTPTVSNLAQSYLEGDSISLTCSTTATTPTPSFRWYRGSSLVSSGPVLSIASATSATNGQYRCEAYNSLGSSDVTVTINVFYKPRASPAVSDVSAAIGQTVTLQCATEANPLPSSYTWTHNGQVVSSAASTSLLTVTVNSLVDLGTYSCRATNDVGTSDLITIDVTEDSGGDGNVGASTEDTGLSTATLVLIIIVILIILVVVVLVIIYFCSTRKCFRKGNDVGPSQAPPAPAVIPYPSKPSEPRLSGYYSREANGHISMEEDKAALNGHPAILAPMTPGLTISVPGGHTPRPHHLPPLGQEGEPQVKESARGYDTPTEKKKKRRRRRHHPEDSSPQRYDPDHINV